MDTINKQQIKVNELEKELKNINFQIKKLSKLLNKPTNITLDNYQQELKELASNPITTTLDDIIKVVTNKSEHKEVYQNNTSNIVLQSIFEFYIAQKKIVKPNLKEEQQKLFKLRKKLIYEIPCYKIGLENHFIEEIKTKHNKFKFTGSANLQYSDWRLTVLDDYKELFPSSSKIIQDQLLYHKIKGKWITFTVQTLEKYIKNGSNN
jgi:hypothetical protein